MLNLVIYDLVEHTMRYGKLSGLKAQTDYYQAMEKIAPSRGAAHQEPASTI